MSNKNLFVAATGDDLTRLEEEYAYIGRHTVRVEGGITVLAYPPAKPKKKKAEPRKKRRDEDEEKPKPTRDQRSKSRA